MSVIQHRAGLRWLFLCRLKGTATFEHARELIPLYCSLKDERTLISSRQEPEWLVAMRNFKRDVDQGKERYFNRAPNGGIRLTIRGLQEFDPMISDTQLNQVIRKKAVAPAGSAGARPAV